MTPQPEQTEPNAPAQSAPQSVQPTAQATPPPTDPTAASGAAPAVSPGAPQPQHPASAAPGGYAPYQPYQPHQPYGAAAQQNPYGAYNPYAQYPQQPQYPYQQYQYPGYAAYAYPGYAPAAPAVTPTAAPVGAPGANGGSATTTMPITPPAAMSRRPGLYALIFGVTLAVLLVAAIALAAVAPSFRMSEASAIPHGWTQVYDANLTIGDDGRWDQTNGCVSQPDGLEAGGPTSDSAGGICVFTPSATNDLTSQGFLLDVTLVAPNNIPGAQDPTINVGDSTYVVFNQQGTYDVCNTACDTANPASIYATGTTSAWHEDGFVGNSIGVELSADRSTLTVFVNGVAVVSTAVSITSSSRAPLIAIGAAQGGQAIFTHATLYSGSATSLS